MSNYNQSNRKPFVPTYLNEMRMRLMGPVLQGAERSSSLSFKIKRNRPAVSVRTNLPNDKNYGLIDAELDGPSFEVLLDMLEKVDQLEPGTKQAIRAMEYPWGPGGRSKELKPQAQVIVGREQDGSAYIAVTSWDSSRPVIKFAIRPSHFTQVIGNDGNVISEVDATLRFAPAWARLLRQAMFQLLVSNYEEPQRNQQGGGGYGNRGGGGGQQRQGGGQQGGGQQPAQQQQQAAAPAAAGEGDGWGGDGWPL